MRERKVWTALSMLPFNPPFAAKNFSIPPIDEIVSSNRSTRSSPTYHFVMSRLPPIHLRNTWKFLFWALHSCILPVMLRCGRAGSEVPVSDTGLTSILL